MTDLLPLRVRSSVIIPTVHRHPPHRVSTHSIPSVTPPPPRVRRHPPPPRLYPFHPLHRHPPPSPLFGIPLLSTAPPPSPSRHPTSPPPSSPPLPLRGIPLLSTAPPPSPSRHPTSPPPSSPPSRRRPFHSHRPPTLIRSAATTFISVFAKSPVIVSPSRASRTNGHGTKVRGSPPGLSSWPSDSAKRKSDERTRSGSESDKMPPLGRVFDIILPHGGL